MVNVAAAEAVRAELNLAQPAIWRFLAWMGELLTLELGKSLVSSTAVREMVMHEPESSVRLALGAVFVSCRPLMDLLAVDLAEHGFAVLMAQGSYPLVRGTCF